MAPIQHFVLCSTLLCMLVAHVHTYTWASSFDRNLGSLPSPSPKFPNFLGPGFFRVSLAFVFLGGTSGW
jgi:hypothetical protein